MAYLAALLTTSCRCVAASAVAAEPADRIPELAPAPVPAIVKVAAAGPAALGDEEVAQLRLRAPERPPLEAIVGAAESSPAEDGWQTQQQRTAAKHRLAPLPRHPWPEGKPSEPAQDIFISLSKPEADVPSLLEFMSSELSLSDAEVIYLVKGLGRQGKWERALEVFSWTRRQERFKLRGVAAASILWVLGAVGRVQAAVELFQNLRQEPGYGLDVYAYTAVISVLAKAGLFDEALAMFETMQRDGQRPNLVTYNVILDIYGKRGDAWDSLLATFEEMKSRPEIKPDDYSYNTMITACGVHGSKCKEAAGFLAEMKAARCTPNRVTYNALLDVYGRAGMHAEAAGLLAEMEAAGVEPNIVTYNELVAAYARSGRAEEAVATVAAAKAKGLIPDAFTYCSLISAFNKAERLNEALAVFNEMKAAGCSPNVVTFNILIDIYGKMRKPDEMVKVFKHMCSGGGTGGPDVVTWNSMLKAYGSLNMPAALSDCFKQMRRSGTPVRVDTLNILIEAYGKCGHLDYSLAIYAGLRRSNLRPTVATYAALLAALAREGRWQQCEAAAAEMASAGLRMSESCHAGMIHAFANAGQLHAMRRYVDGLEQRQAEQRWRPGIVLSRTLVLAFAKSGLEAEAEAAMEALYDAGHSPDIKVYNALLAMYARRGLVEPALGVVDRIRRASLRPDTATYNCLVAMYGREGMYAEAEALVARMGAEAGGAPNLISFNTLLYAYGRHGRMDDAARVFADMIVAGIRPDAFTYNTLVGCYAAQGLFQDALAVIEYMTQNGVKPTQVTYKALLDGYSRTGGGNTAAASAAGSPPFRKLEIRGFLTRITGSNGWDWDAWILGQGQSEQALSSGGSAARRASPGRWTSSASPTFSTTMPSSRLPMGWSRWSSFGVVARKTRPWQQAAPAGLAAGPLKLSRTLPKLLASPAILEQILKRTFAQVLTGCS